MILKKTNNSSLRLNNLDFLRGFFVVLALLEHYSFFLNKWYVEYFRDFSAVKTIYSSHLDQLGKILLSDTGTNILGLIFIPWVSQIYLALASFNISKDSSEDLNAKLSSVLKKITVLFFVFYLENFIVANDFGQAISFNPIMLWMIILGLINIFYAKFGVRGIYFLTTLSLLRWILPIHELSIGIEEFIQTRVHPSFEYDAKIEYFFTSGCLGFLLGYLHYHAKVNYNKVALGISFLSIFIIIAYFTLTSGYEVDPADIYLHEHDCARTLIGSSFLWAVQALIISNFVLLERNGLVINISFFKWVGVNSLLVFLAHKILFLKVVMPFTTYFYAILGWKIENNYYEVFAYTGIVLFLCWMIQKLQLGSIINGNSRKD